jgi:hypothetical protein
VAVRPSVGVMSDDPGACTEPELTEPVDLCTDDGRLNPDAVGWSRRPLHRGALPGSWGRRKRWDFWGITGPGCALNVVVADVDYIGLADVWFHDAATGRDAARSVMVPLARGVALPDRPGEAPIVVERGGLAVSIVEEPRGTRLRVAFGGEGRSSGGGPGPDGGFRADVLVRRTDGHESLSVVIPWSERRFQLTTKDVARPAEGTVVWEGRTHELRADGTSWGCLDFGRGKWPYRTRWNWGAGAGIVDLPGGPATVGLQLGGKWTDGTGMTENALCVDGRLSKLSEELVWTYDTTDWLRPWTIRTPRSDRLDLTFTPTHDKPSRLQLGVVAQSVDQCFGTYAGTIVPDDGPPLAIDGIVGWAEEATWRW